MVLRPMAPGGQWFMSPIEGVPVYVPAKQLEAHRKRLVAEDGWTPIPDPRHEEDQPLAQSESLDPEKIAMRAEIDQLKSMVMQLLAQKEQTHDGTQHDVKPDSKNAGDDKRPGGRKSAV